MQQHTKKGWVLLSLIFLMIPANPVHAQPKAGAGSEDLLGRLRSMELRIQKIEANEQEILTRQDKILAELENLRVWVARR